MVGLEVKSGSELGATSGMAEFERRFGSRPIVVGPSGVPLHEFLSLPADHWFDVS